MEARADELERFGATVAHDLLSPLASLGIAMPVIQQRHSEDEQTQRLTKSAIASVQRVRELVLGLLEFARSGGNSPGAMAEVDQVLTDVAAELHNQACAAKASIELKTGGGTAACQPGVLYSVVNNLISNALKYLGIAHDRRIFVRSVPRGDTVRIEVDDAGPGVPANLAEVIFEPYVRVSGSGKPGLGLGLATVKRIVVAHGGRAGVDGSPRGGALFGVELPVGPSVHAPHPTLM
jgi:signal transduction histidine kinase